MNEFDWWLKEKFMKECNFDIVLKYTKKIELNKKLYNKYNHSYMCNDYIEIDYDIKKMFESEIYECFNDIEYKDYNSIYFCNGFIELCRRIYEKNKRYKFNDFFIQLDWRCDCVLYEKWFDDDFNILKNEYKMELREKKLKRIIK